MKRPASMEARRNELLDDIENCISHTLKRHAVPDQAAERAATAAVDFLVNNWGGQQLTFPRLHAERRQARDADMLARVGRVGVAGLAREFRMTEAGVRKAIHRARQRQETRCGVASKAAASLRAAGGKGGAA